MKTEFKYNRFDKNDVAVLLVDHQSGLTNCVQDFSPGGLQNEVQHPRCDRVLSWEPNTSI